MDDLSWGQTRQVDNASNKPKVAAINQSSTSPAPKMPGIDFLSQHESTSTNVTFKPDRGEGYQQSHTRGGDSSKQYPEQQSRQSRDKNRKQSKQKNYANHDHHKKLSQHTSQQQHHQQFQGNAAIVHSIGYRGSI